eukprot:6183913-Pleurochrysis_carterae.AAC.1
MVMFHRFAKLLFWSTTQCRCRRSSALSTAASCTTTPRRRTCALRPFHQEPPRHRMVAQLYAEMTSEKLPDIDKLMTPNRLLTDIYQAILLCMAGIPEREICKKDCFTFVFKADPRLADITIAS